MAWIDETPAQRVECLRHFPSVVGVTCPWVDPCELPCDGVTTVQTMTGAMQLLQHSCYAADSSATQDKMSKLQKFKTVQGITSVDGN